MYKKKLIIVIFLVTVGVVILSAIAVFLVSKMSSNSSIDLTNYKEFMPKLDDARVALIEHSVYSKVEEITPENKNNAKTMVIREDSYSETTSSLGVVESVFIIDISSIKQSYKITYRWTNTDADISSNALVISCVESSKMIYPDFGCQEVIGSTAESDPIINLLPYSTIHYKVSVNPLDDSGKTNLVVTIFLYMSDIRGGGKDASVARYKESFLSWLKSNNINPDDYIISYEIDSV